MNIKPIPAQMIIQMEYEEGFHDGYRQAMREMPEIVRCKDCKKRDSWECWQYFLGRIKIPDDWFCADGEKRE